MGLIIDCFTLKDKILLIPKIYIYIYIYTFNKSYILHNFNQVSGFENLKTNVVGNTQIRAVHRYVRYKTKFHDVTERGMSA